MGSSSTKKRKDPPPNHTLLDFFPTADAIKRARARASHQSTSSVRQNGLKVASRETIVIESDNDEDDAHGKENGNKNVQLDPRIGVSQDAPSLNSASTSNPPRSDTFGMPSELLPPFNFRMEAASNRFHAHQHSPIIAEQDHSNTMFDVSAPLLEQIPLRNQLPETSQTNLAPNESIYVPAKAVGSSANDVAVEVPIGEWAAGDDELVDLEILDNDAETDEREGAPFSEKRTCPVCSVDLAGIHVLEAQTHVNQCLDATLQNDDFVMQECTSNAVSIEPCVSSDDGGPSTLVKGQGGDLYTVLMNSHNENDTWMEVDALADRGFKSARGIRRRAPFYKILQGFPIAVDAFCYGTIPGVTAYFLSHAHSDHYTNLGSKWKSGPIYCSEETANLIIHMLSVDPTWIHPLPMDTRTVIPDTGGVSVTPIAANHCPGSCLFVFEGKQTIDAGDSSFKSPFIGSQRIFRYLHCGDFRASPYHVHHPAVKGKHIDHIYLDTTYLDPKYIFSPQPLVISACSELARRLLARGVSDNLDAHNSSKIDTWMKPSTSADMGGHWTFRKRILVVVGTYSIGKERIVKAIAHALGAKIYCDPRKIAILRCQADKELHALLTADPIEADVHILPLGTVTSDNLKLYLEKFKGTFSKVIGFRPTGWTYSPPAGSNLDPSIQSVISRGQSQRFSYTDLRLSQKSSYDIQIFGVPYSEHSSFFELTCFAMSCDWGRIIPTVNVGTPTSRARMIKWVKRWEIEKRCIKLSVIQPRADDYW